MEVKYKGKLPKIWLSPGVSYQKFQADFKRMDRLINSLIKNNIEFEYRFLSLSARRNHEATIRALVYTFRMNTGSRRSASDRSLNDVQLYARKPVVCVPLIPAYKRAKINFCRRFVQWSQENVVSVLFTESRDSLNTDSK